MTRTAFLAALEQLLAPLPEAERKDALSYYEDYLDAAGPEKEAQAIAELGTPEEVAHKILEEQAPADPSAAPAAPAGNGVSGAPISIPQSNHWQNYWLSGRVKPPKHKGSPEPI